MSTATLDNGKRKQLAQEITVQNIQHPLCYFELRKFMKESRITDIEHPLVKNKRQEMFDDLMEELESLSDEDIITLHAEYALKQVSGKPGV